MIKIEYTRKVIDSYEDTLELNFNIPDSKYKVNFKTVDPKEFDSDGATYVEWKVNVQFNFITERWGEQYIEVKLTGESWDYDAYVEDISIPNNEALVNNYDFMKDVLNYLNNRNAIMIVADTREELSLFFHFK